MVKVRFRMVKYCWVRSCVGKVTRCIVLLSSSDRMFGEGKELVDHCNGKVKNCKVMYSRVIQR